MLAVWRWDLIGGFLFLFLSPERFRLRGLPYSVFVAGEVVRGNAGAVDLVIMIPVVVAAIIVVIVLVVVVVVVGGGVVEEGIVLVVEVVVVAVMAVMMVKI